MSVFFFVGVSLSLYQFKSNLNGISQAKVSQVNKELDIDLEIKLKRLFKLRNQSLLNQDKQTLKSLHDREVRNGLWAYETELKKIKYLREWANKQGVEFKEIESDFVVQNVKEDEIELEVRLAVATDYSYQYQSETTTDVDSFRLGTYHVIKLRVEAEELVITQNWYNDPLASRIDLKQKQEEEIKKQIVGHSKKEVELAPKREAAVNYADRYLGAATPDQYQSQYNPNYKNYNYTGGDCTNFASQMLYEAGEFSKDGTWNYRAGAGTRAWVNANSFNQYMIHSHKADLIAYGSYKEVLDDSYRLLPGDYIAYGKAREADHISVVTGVDSKGYRLVNSHNSDRYRVPWDIGWNEQGVKFWLVRVNY